MTGVPRGNPGAGNFVTLRMAALHNRVSQKELKARLYEETEARTTLSFYRYFPIADPKTFRDELYLGLNSLSVFGRIYVAGEGINAQISVPVSGFAALQAYLSGIPGLEGLRLKDRKSVV